MPGVNAPEVLLKSEAFAVVEVFATVTVVVVTVVWSVTRGFEVPQLLLPPFDLHVVVTETGALPASNTGVTVAETAMLPVLRSTGDVAVTRLTLTEGVPGPANKLQAAATNGKDFLIISGYSPSGSRFMQSSCI